MSGWNETTLFSVFVNAALKSTLLFGLAWLACIAFRRRSAAARHIVWSVVAAAVVVLPLLSFAIPALRLPGGLLPDVVFETTTSATTDSGASPANPMPTITPEGTQMRWHTDWKFWFMLLWAVGAANSLAQMIAGQTAVRRAKRSATRFADAGLCTRLSRVLGVERKVQVLESAPGSMPIAVGLLRPAIFLPADAAQWGEERLRVVMLHELAHVRRGDAWTHWLARTALMLYWWNPLAWKAWREFLKERERATDDLVLNSGAGASDYAGHLLAVASSLRVAPAVAWAGVAMARQSQLEGRLIAILDSGVNRRTPGREYFTVAALIAAAIVAPLAAVRAQDSSVIATDQQTAEYAVRMLKPGELDTLRGYDKSAEALYTRAVQILGDKPDATPALIYLGEGAIRQKDYAKALGYFHRVEIADPTNAGTALMWMAVAQREAQKPDEADSLFKSALTRQDPKSSAAATTMLVYAQFLHKQKRDTEAANLETQALAVQKANAIAPKLPPDALRIGPGITAPRPLQRNDPAYSEAARMAHLAGTVVLSIMVGTDGFAHNIQIVRGLGLGLDDEAAAAVGKWTFQPATKDGQPVPVAAMIEVNFRLL